MTAFLGPAVAPAAGLRTASVPASRSRAHSTLVMTAKYAVGQKVRVSGECVMYHIPPNRNKPTDVDGMVGEVLRYVDERKGIEITATKPVLVKFTEPKFMAHFGEDEIEEA